MNFVKSGDHVARKSYGLDIVFTVRKVEESETGAVTAILFAFDVRLMASAPVEDLVILDHTHFDEVVNRSEEHMSRKTDCCIKNRLAMSRGGAAGGGGDGDGDGDGEGSGKKDITEFPGKVLHLDGDSTYLEHCMKHYEKLAIRAHGEHVPEPEQPERVAGLIERYQPDMLVMTGHDGYSRKQRGSGVLDQYYHSKYFAEAVRKARIIRPDKDSFVIFAGACQSHYEAILEAGANYASSPKRTLINCYDPVLVAEKICFTSIGLTADIAEVIENTITGKEGIGGIETRGLYRLGMPALSEEVQ